MSSRAAGCTICGATWGDYWEEVDGKKFFFCCEVCAKQYRNLLDEVKIRTRWDSVDALEMEGDYRGRVCRASRGSDSFKFLVNFFENGDVRTFVEKE
jgi:putative zinc binding protein